MRKSLRVLAVATTAASVLALGVTAAEAQPAQQHGKLVQTCKLGKVCTVTLKGFNGGNLTVTADVTGTDKTTVLSAAVLEKGKKIGGGAFVPADQPKVYKLTKVAPGDIAVTAPVVKGQTTVVSIAF